MYMLILKKRTINLENLRFLHTFFPQLSFLQCTKRVIFINSRPFTVALQTQISDTKLKYFFQLWSLPSEQPWSASPEGLLQAHPTTRVMSDRISCRKECRPPNATEMKKWNSYSRSHSILSERLATRNDEMLWLCVVRLHNYNPKPCIPHKMQQLSSYTTPKV